MRLNKIKIKYICMKKRDMIYIRVEIQTSPVALRYLGVMIWENHIRELWEYFNLWKTTLNRAYAPMSSHPDSEDLFGIKRLYDIIIFSS